MKIQNSTLLKIFSVCAAIAVATPLFYSGNLLYSRLLLRATSFQVLIGAMFVVWIVLMMRDKNFRPKKHPLVIAFLVFLFALLVNLAVSIEPHFSFWSRGLRMMGIFHYLFYIAWFLMLISVYKTRDEWKRLFVFSNVVCLIIGAIGIIMHALDISSVVGRVESVFRNPAFLAAYLLPHIFIALVLWKKENSKRLKYFFLFSAAAHLLVMVLSGTRSALLGLFVAFLFGLFLFFVRSKVSKKHKILLVALLAAVFLSTVLSAAALRATKSEEWAEENLPYTVFRAVYRADTGRFALWDIALDGFQERPLLGWGFNNYGVVFGYHVEPGGEHVSLPNDWNNRAHNQFIDYLTTIGIVGLAAYLSIWIVLAVMLARCLRKSGGDDFVVTSLLTAFVIAYAVHLSFMFDVPSGVMASFMLLAFIVFETDQQQGRSSKQWLSRLPEFNVGLVTILFLLAAMGVFQYFFSIKPLWKAYLNETAYNLVKTDHEKGLTFFKKSFEGEVYLFPDLSYRLATAVKTNDIGDSETDLQILQLAANETEKTALRLPYEYEAQLVASAMQSFNAPYDDSAIEKGKAFVEKAVDLAPMRSEGPEQLAEFAIMENDYSEAKDFLEEAVKLARDERRGAAYYRLALVYANLGDVERALDAIELSRLDEYPVYQDPEPIIIIARELQSADFAPEEAAVQLERYLLVGSGDINLLIAAIVIYVKSDEIEKASSILDRVDEINPGVAESIREEFEL